MHDLWKAGENCMRVDFFGISPAFEALSSASSANFPLLIATTFTDVYPGDGGLNVIPGSSKSGVFASKQLLTLDESDGVGIRTYSPSTTETPSAMIVK